MSDRTVLVIEDDDDCRDLLGEYITSKFHCSSLTAPGIIEAASLLRTKKFSLIVSEHEFFDPAITGDDLIRELQDTAESTPVIFYTKSEHVSETQLKRFHHPCSVVQKPWLGSLEKEISEFLHLPRPPRSELFMEKHF